MLDTGASVTCVSSSLPGLQHASLQPADSRPVSANGSPLKCLGYLITDVVVSPGLIQNKMKVLVIENLSAPGILGNDVLRKFGNFTVDYRAQTLMLGGHRISLERRMGGAPNQPVPVCLAHTCVVEPHSERLVQVQARDFGGKPRDVVFDPDISRISRLGVSLSPTVVRSCPKNVMPLLICNTSNEGIKLFENTVLGEARDVQLGGVEQKSRTSKCGPVHVDLSGAEVSAADKTRVQKMLNEFRDVFANDNDELGRTHLREFRIETGDSPPIAVRARRTPYHLRGEVARQISNMERLDIIQKSNSPWSAPLLMVKKSDGGYRFAVDFRALNAETATEVAYLPSVRECLDSLAGSQLYTTLDLNSAYWQVPIAVQDRPKSAFSTETNQWEFKVMPFGMKNAPSCFVRLMSDVLRGLLGNGVTAYLDDIIVGGRNTEEHLSLLRAVLERLREAGLTVKSQKVVPCRRRLRFLGHLVSGDGIEPDPEKLEVIKSWPRPSSTKEVRSFLGLCTYYTDFVDRLQCIAAPLHQISGKAKFEWNGKHEEAFRQLKNALCEQVVLQFPDMSREFEVSTDASDLGLGCILSQRDEQGRDRPVCFASKVFTENEKNWHIRDKEAFAFVFALRKFRAYLLGKPFRWYTDHRSLTWLQTTRDPRGRYSRWVEEISEYDFTVQYRRGEHNVHADAVSRAQVCATRESKPIFFESLSEEDMLKSQLEDRELKKLVEEIRLGRTDGPATKKWRKFGWKVKLRRESGVLVGHRKRTEMVLIPEKLISLALRLKHDSAGHFGTRKTEELLIHDGYGWLGMREDVRSYCRSCVVCAKSNDPPKKFRAPLSVTTQPTEPWQHVALDLMGPIGPTATQKGNRYVLVALDLFTKGIELAAIRDKSAKTVAEALVDQVFYRHGLPESLLTDRGLEFDNQYMAAIAQAVGLDRKKISAFHPQSNGAVERCNQTVGSLLRRTVQDQAGDWDEFLGMIRFQYMTSMHSTTGHTPFFLQFGRAARAPALTESVQPTGRPPDQNSWVRDLIERLSKAHEGVVAREEKLKKQRKEKSESTANSMRYEAGDRVFMRCPRKPGLPGKLQPRWDGPYIVVARRQGDVYQVKKEDNFRRRYVRHHDELKPFVTRSDRLQGQATEPCHPKSVREKSDGTHVDAPPMPNPREDNLPSSSDSSEDVSELYTSSDGSSAHDSSDESSASAAEAPPTVRRGTRDRRSPVRYPAGEWMQ